jgi:hypothetical protein
MSLVTDRILNLAVQRVRERCRLAFIDARINPPSGDTLHPLTLAAAGNREILLSAALSAQLVLDDQVAAAKRQSRVIPEQRAADDDQ